MHPARTDIRDLASAPDEVVALFERWHADQVLTPPLSADCVEVLKLAVYEWVANLVQHATFPDGAPLIRITVAPSGERISCAIEDNSAGFDLDRQIALQRATLLRTPLAERGRGLLILLACARDVCYQPVPPPTGCPLGDLARPRHRLTFWISPTPDVCLDIPF